MTLTRRPRSAVLAVAALLMFGGACAAPRNSLNTGASVCFRALPAARAAVHGKGKLVGVRRVPRATVAKRFPEVTFHSRAQLCLVAFRDDYDAGDVDRAPGGGRYAVVVLDARTSEVIHTSVTGRLPMRFRHRF